MARVEVEEGILEGEILSNECGNIFYSFKGIPYAEPPIGDLRFKAPKPKKPWQGVRQAKQHGSICYQHDNHPPFAAKGNEDCLYLNVYTPTCTPIKLPVMVYIHGGAFRIGDGNSDRYGPVFLLKHNVILVTINYRLEILGFLCLDSKDIPGNAGMKDQVAALRWVQKNIRNFGGDPDNVTIFGESAGGASVSFHLVSPMSKGLFKRAIMQSGSITCWWSTVYKARERALLLARELGCTAKNDEEICDFLKHVPVEKLSNKNLSLSFAESTKLGTYLFFAIVSEKYFDGEERFFEGDVYDALRNGIHDGVDVINGYNEHEGIICLLGQWNLILEQANRYLEHFVPQPLPMVCSMINQLDVGEKFKNHFLKGEPLTKQTAEQFLKYLSMEGFVYGILSWQKICAKRNKNKIYLYKFRCTSERNIFTKKLGADKLFDQRVMVSHADDLAYLFPAVDVPKVDPALDSYRMIQQLTKLWTNFAKFGDPTPEDDLGVKWRPYTMKDEEYLDIGSTLTPKYSPEKEDMEFFENIFREYYPHVVP
ncbi:unnamed protein product [Leptidea sinapis]|uniref:Carboxylic ester hydrolase n=1 Tax=Leptidea sinapis TaxID=189913 RepID=A0A5E4Q6G1_9NEOP|nr:unnamed protein product [Leptidea sinapis]